GPMAPRLRGDDTLGLCARRLGLALEVLQHARPAAVDVLAHLGAAFRAHALELAVLQLHQRRMRPLGNEPDLDFGAHGEIRLPVAVEVPADDETLRRLPYQHPADVGLRAVLAQLVPAPAQARLHGHRFHRRLADRRVARPPAVEPGGEDFEGARLADIDADILAYRRDGHRRCHTSLSFL